MVDQRSIQEALPWKCSNMDLHSLEWGKETLLDTGDFLVKVTRKKDGNLKLHLQATKIEFEAKLTLFEVDIED